MGNVETSKHRSDAAAVATVRECRGSDRLPLEVEVSSVSDHNFYLGFSSNVSEGGIFVATHTLLPVGSQLAIRFSLPGDSTSMLITTEVRWVREHNESSDTAPGLGLKFVNLSAETLLKIQSFVCSHDPLFHDD